MWFPLVFFIELNEFDNRMDNFFDFLLINNDLLNIARGIQICTLTNDSEKSVRFQAIEWRNMTIVGEANK